MLHTITLALFMLVGSFLAASGGFILVGREPVFGVLQPLVAYPLSLLVNGLVILAASAWVFLTNQARITRVIPHWNRGEALRYAALSTGVLCLLLDNYAAAACAYSLCLLVQNQPIKITPASTRAVEPPSTSTSEPASSVMVGADSSILDVA